MTTKIATPAGQVIVGRGSPATRWFEGVAAEAITKHQLLYVDSAEVTGAVVSANHKGSTIRRKMGVATNATRKKACGSLFYALTNVALNGKCEFTEVAVLANLDTSGATLGDPVYLSTAGLPTLTRPTAGYPRVVGEVIGVGAVGVGLWNFTGGQPIDNPILTGVAVVTSGTATVTVANPFGLGAALTGRPIWSSLVEAEAGEGMSAITWSTNDLVITTIGNTAADRDVRYFILG